MATRRDRTRARARLGVRWAVLGLWAMVIGGCSDDVAPAPEEVEAPSTPPADVGEAAAEVEADVFALPGLDAWRPAPRLGWPVQSVHITSSYGWRVDPVSGRGTRLHRGVDFRGSPGDLVLSIGAGQVEFVGHDPFLGNMIIVDHGEGLRSLYGHLSDVLVAAQMPVDRGAAIGLVGNTGRSAAPHLHLTVKLDGVAIDPLEVLREPLHRPQALVTGLAPAAASAPTAPTPASVEVAPGAAPLARHALPHRSDDGGP